MNDSKEYVSSDAPPLDFSFKKIKNLQDIKFIPPRQGQRLNPVDEEGKPLNSKPSKEEEVDLQAKEKESVQQKNQKKKVEITKLLPESTINSVVGSMVATSAMKNISTKAKEQLEKKKKKAIHVKLVCCSLMLCYNKIRELQRFEPVISTVMPQHTNLQWLDISHNYLQHLDYDFSHYPHLRTLYIHCNFLYDFNDLGQLKNSQNLKTMTVHGNPLTDVSNFRCYVISILPQIRKLDSVLVSNKEKDNAVFLRTQIKKFPMPKNIPSPPIQKNQNDQEEQKQNI